MPFYRTKCNVLAGGDIVAPGQIAELDEDEAAPLVALDAIERDPLDPEKLGDEAPKAKGKGKSKAK